MATALKTRNPLILFESNSNAISKPVSRNPITGGEQSFQPAQVSKKPIDRNPIIQTEANPVMRASLNLNNKPARNPIVADKNEFAIKIRDNNTYKDSNIFGPSQDQTNRPSTTKNNPTYSSNLFNGPKLEATNRKKLVTDLSTDQLFGDYKDAPVKKPHPKEYMPNFLDMSPEQRSFAKTQWDSQVCNHVVDNQKKDVDGNYAFAKKQEEFVKSNIFNQNQNNLHENYQKPAPIEGQEDVKSDKKKLMRNYSDLFNLPQYENAQKEKKEIDENRMIDENEQNLDAHSKRLKDLYSSTLANDDLKQTYQNSVKASHNEIKQKVKKFEGNDAKHLKQMELKSNLMGNENNEVNYENIKNPVFYDFDVNGVSQDFETTKFKQFCAKNGYHLVEYKANMNSLNTGNDGTGRLKLRIPEENNLNDIKSKLYEMGMDVNNHTEEHKLKHNFLGVAKLDWKDSNCASQERRLNGEEFIDAKESKMKDLESNGDIFGNSKGVGKWDSQWKASQKNKKDSETNYTPENNVQALNWKKTMKNVDRMKNPMYKTGTNFQSQKLFSTTNSKMVSNWKK